MLGTVSGVSASEGRGAGASGTRDASAPGTNASGARDSKTLDMHRANASGGRSAVESDVGSTKALNIQGGRALELQAVLNKAQSQIAAAKTWDQRRDILSKVRLQLEQNERNLSATDENAEAVVDLNVAFGPIFSANFTNDKVACTPKGVRQEIRSMYLGPLSVGAKSALLFLAAICGKPKLGEL